MKYYRIRLVVSLVFGILSLFAIFGLFYPVKFMNFQFIALLERNLFDFSFFALLLFMVIIGLSLVFGRIYCSTICPFGILQEIITLIKRKKTLVQKNYPYKYLISGITFGVLFGGTAVIIRYIDPYTIFSSALNLSIIGIIITLAVIILTFLKDRFFCTNICPVGTILGLISKYSINKIYIDEKSCVSCGFCADNCPSGCINKEERIIDNETCIKCLKCLKVCKGNAIKYGRQPVKFNFNRRKALWAGGVLTLFAAGVASGIAFTKKLASNVKNIILPPGAVDAERMANKCLNCNLCVANCPNKILSKADKNFSAVYIDFEKGKNFCKYDCKICSEVCPSGAIKKITLDEKKKIKIATAKINSDCSACRHCVSACPVGAITIEKRMGEYQDSYNNISTIAKVNEAKCIGCGKCMSVCRFHAIDLFAEEKQSSV